MPETGKSGSEAVRLFPGTLPGEPSAFPADEIHRYLELPEPPEDTPHVLLNAVSSVDGRVAVNGRSGGIGSAVDRATMRNLRSHVDAVMIGAGSLRAERMDLRVPEYLENLRLQRGLEAQPTGIILSRSGNVPLDNLPIPTVRDYNSAVSDKERGQRILVLINADNTEPRHNLTNTIGNWSIDSIETNTSHMGDLLSYLRRDFGVKRLLLEGGPSLNHDLISGGLLDELFITLSPKLLAGRPDLSPSLLSGLELKEYSEQDKRLNLLSVHISGSELFLRYSTESK